jgi:DNA-binding CsgD family transcriptional regulator
MNRNGQRQRTVHGAAEGEEEYMSAQHTGWAHDNLFIEPLGLTDREVEVLTWVADGKTNAEIGLILGTSKRTVQKHLEHIFEKLGVETHTAAAVCILTLTASQEPHIALLPAVAA